MMNTQEAYKNYQRKHLPQCKTIEGYEAPDFDPDAYPEWKDELGKLEFYLIDLRKYVKKLVKAAALRQTHYENYIEGNAEENKDHRYFRLALNSIAVDAQEKLSYWESISNDKFSKVLKDQNKIDERQKKVQKNRKRLGLYVKNVDFEPEVKSRRVTRKPKISSKEKARKAKEKKRRKKIKEDEELKLLEKYAEEKAQIIKKVSTIFGENVLFDMEILDEQIDNFGNRPIILPEFRKDKYKTRIIPIFYNSTVDIEMSLGKKYSKLLLGQKSQVKAVRLEELKLLRHQKIFRRTFVQEFISRVPAEKWGDVLTNVENGFQLVIQTILKSEYMKIIYVLDSEKREFLKAVKVSTDILYRIEMLKNMIRDMRRNPKLAESIMVQTQKYKPEWFSSKPTFKGFIQHEFYVNIHKKIISIIRDEFSFAKNLQC